MSSVSSHIHNNMFTAPGFSNRFLVESDLFISYLLCGVVFLFVLLCLIFFSFFFMLLFAFLFFNECCFLLSFCVFLPILSVSLDCP
jgi:hypothetical protein